MFRAAVLTVSDKGARGERVDTSGAAVCEILATAGATIEQRAVVPDEQPEIEAVLRSWSDGGDIELIVTTGGTGLSPRDVTPEATLAVADRLVPGLAEAMRAQGLRKTPMAMLSRGQSVLRGSTLILNLPGSEKAVRENLIVVLPVLAHALDTLRGSVGDHRAESGGTTRAGSP
jgi:molybdenum cofactor synthesis domain-containing protein